MHKISNPAVPWVEKYRPNSLDDITSHEDIINTLDCFIFPKDLTQEARLPHLLLYGPPGTGKTSTILAIAKQLFKSKAAWNDHILELNASDDRGIDVVRNKIINFVSMKCIVKEDNIPKDFQNLKIVVLDEADAMTKDAQNALRRIIEKYTKTTRFCLICNYISKIIPAIQSRCTRFRFSPLNDDQLLDRINHVVSKENIDIDQSGLDALVKQSGGDMRRALNALQSCSLANEYKNINSDKIYATIGQPNPDIIQDIFNSLMNDSVKESMNIISDIKIKKGVALQDIIEELHLLLLSYDLDDIIFAKIVQRLAEIEFRLSKGCNDELQVGALVAAFHFLREEQICASSTGNEIMGTEDKKVPDYVVRSY